MRDYDSSLNSGGGGGGIYNDGTLTVNECTLTGNQSDSGESYYYGAGGGGICNNAGNLYNNDDGTATVNQCTLTGNHADNDAYGGGGGIYNQDTLTVNQSTLTGNHADNGTENGGGGGIVDFAGFTIYNSIVAGNSATNGAGTDIASQYPIFNVAKTLPRMSPLSWHPPAPTPINAAPQLAALGNYGGPTQTMPPLPGSPAIDACTDSTFSTDQRGFPRLLGAFPDIGAVEGIYNTNGPGKLAGLKRLGNGSTRFTFTNYTDGSSTVLASTNVALPLNLWTNLGPAVESPIGSRPKVSIHRPAGDKTLSRATLLPRAFTVSGMFARWRTARPEFQTTRAGQVKLWPHFGTFIT